MEVQILRIEKKTQGIEIKLISYIHLLEWGSFFGNGNNSDEDNIAMFHGENN